MEYKPNCYECKHRRPLAGNAHSKCMHPVINFMWGSTAGVLISLIGGVPPIIPTVKLNGDDVPVVQFNQHGIKNGWASWPFNFDPVWLEFCVFWVNDQIEKEIKEANDAESSVRKV